MLCAYKFQISFQVFGEKGHNDSGGEIEIEKVPTRVVEVRKKDLVPVFDRLRNYQFGDDVRCISLIILPIFPFFPAAKFLTTVYTQLVYTFIHRVCIDHQHVLDRQCARVHVCGTLRVL